MTQGKWELGRHKGSCRGGMIHNAQTKWSWRMKDDPEVAGDVFDGKRN
jgi:hypothetical protein